jgi:isoleucyl-tRNA synthetase
MHRVPEVIDVWFDSGSMPFAQHHAPFENRGATSVVPRRLHLRGARPDARLVLLAARDLDAAQRPAPYRNVVCLGLLLDGEGQKMSKSKGNVVDPWEVIDRFGADAFRWYFFTSKQPWDGYRFSARRGRRGRCASSCCSCGTCTASSCCTRMRLRADRLRRPSSLTRRRWGMGLWGRPPLSWIGGCARGWPRPSAVRERLDGYDATTAGRAIGEFVEELSNWYVRRSRPALLGRRAGGVCDAARVPRDRRQAARAVHAVHRR